MNRVLFSAVAALAVGGMCSTAVAADRIQLKLGGFSRWYFAWAEQDDAFLTQGGTGGVDTAADDRNYSDTNVFGDNEIFISGSTKLDNGITVGILTELEAGGHPDDDLDGIDQAYVYLEGGFGRVELGMTKQAAERLLVSAPGQSFLSYSHEIQGITVLNPGISATSGAESPIDAAIGRTNVAEKITYLTPKFEGFQAGISYTPEVQGFGLTNGQYQQTRGFTDINAGGASGGGAVTGGAYGDAWTFGARYQGKFGDVGVNLGGGYHLADGGVAFEKFDEWYVGANISYAGFSFGGSYNEVEQETSGSNVFNATAGFGSNLAGRKGANDGHSWNLGANYKTGPWEIGLGYFIMEAEGNDFLITGVQGDQGEDSVELWRLRGAYDMGPGIRLIGSVAWVDWDDERANTTVATFDNEGWSVITGIELAF